MFKDIYSTNMKFIVLIQFLINLLTETLITACYL